MNTVGSMLKEAREKKHLSIAQIEKATKIRAKFLEAIEGDAYDSLPSLTYAKGFVQNYSDVLGLERERVMAFFRRQTEEVPRWSLLPHKEDAVLARTIFRMTPGRFLMLVVFVLVIVFSGYLLVGYSAIQRPPGLTLESPKESTITADRRIDVFGKTDPDATVTVNSVSVLVRSDGKFFDHVALEPGVNKIMITATSRYGKSTTITRDVGLNQ